MILGLGEKLDKRSEFLSYLQKDQEWGEDWLFWYWRLAYQMI